MNHATLEGAQPLSVGLAVLLFATLGLTQEPAAPGGKQEKLTAIKQSMAQNQARLKQYTWTETTQISLKGEVKKTEQKHCQYGPDGKVQKTEIPGAPAQQQQQTDAGRRKGGRLKKEIVQKKVGEIKDYMERVAALVHEYVPPNPERIKAAQAAGNVSFQPVPGGVATLGFKNYLKDGDSLVLDFDSAAKQIRRVNVHSYLDNPKDDPVTLAVTFASLPDGTNYAQKSVLDATAKKVNVTVTNSGYQKAAQ